MCHGQVSWIVGLLDCISCGGRSSISIGICIYPCHCVWILNTYNVLTLARMEVNPMRTWWFDEVDNGVLQATLKEEDQGFLKGPHCRAESVPIPSDILLFRALKPASKHV